MANFGYNRPEAAGEVEYGERFQPNHGAGAGGGSAHHVSSSMFGNTTASKTSFVG